MTLPGRWSTAAFKARQEWPHAPIRLSVWKSSESRGGADYMLQLTPKMARRLGRELLEAAAKHGVE